MKDKRIRETVMPVSIVFASGEIANREILLSESDLQIGLDETHIATVRGKACLLFDFGREMQGGVRILAQTAEGGSARVRIRFGESVAESSAEMCEKGATNDHSLRDIETLLVNFSDMEFGQTGFRFVRLDFLDDREVRLKAVLAVSVMRDLHPIGDFRCDDDRINEIFRVSSRTLMLNMQNYIWDGIKRDRLVWIGDMHPETLGIGCLFGSDESVERSLSYVRDHTPLPNWMNQIPMYSMWWLVILHDYYMQNANLTYLREQRDYIDGLVRLIDSCVRADGSLDFGQIFFDWPSHGSADEEAGVAALCRLTARKACSLFGLLGLDDAICRGLLEKLGQKTYMVAEMKQCEAFLVYAGLKDATEAFGLLSKGGANGLSTFMSYYILDAVAKVDQSCALAMMKDYYGAMLDLGATSFWENFEYEWRKNSGPIDRFPRTGENDVHGDFGGHCFVGYRHSLCHGWSCGPISYLLHSVAGIRIEEAGCRKLSVRPDLGSLNRIRAVYPTPFGPVTVEAMRKGDTTEVRCQGPEEVEITVLS